MGELKDWCWMHYEKYIMIEYLQCKKEGLIVDDLDILLRMILDDNVYYATIEDCNIEELRRSDI